MNQLDSVSRTKGLNLQVLFKNHKIKEMKSIIFKLKKQILENRIDIQTIFSDFDKDNSGSVSFFTFSYILESVFNLNNKEIQKIVDILTSNSANQNTEQISYYCLQELIDNSQRIQDFSFNRSVLSSMDTSENVSNILMTCSRNSNVWNKDSDNSFIAPKDVIPNNKTSFNKMTSIQQNNLFSPPVKSAVLQRENQTDLLNVVSNTPKRKSHFSPDASIKIFKNEYTEQVPQQESKYNS